MPQATQTIEFEIIFEAKHWNHNCACMIPAAYTALVYIDDEAMPKWPCGDTHEEAVANVLREHPNAKQLQ